LASHVSPEISSYAAAEIRLMMLTPPQIEPPEAPPRFHAASAARLLFEADACRIPPPLFAAAVSAIAGHFFDAAFTLLSRRLFAFRYASKLMADCFRQAFQFRLLFSLIATPLSPLAMLFDFRYAAAAVSPFFIFIATLRRCMSFLTASLGAAAFAATADAICRHPLLQLFLR
jgi:hypothetical protein